MSKIHSFLLTLFFGKDSLKGYYNPTNQKTIEKKYILSSIFPNQAIVDDILRQDEFSLGDDDKRETRIIC